MEPVWLVAEALVAGASQGLGDAAVADAYGRLKTRLRAHLKRKQLSDQTLIDFEVDPSGGTSSLAAYLTDTGVADEIDLINSAQQVLELLGMTSRSSIVAVKSQGIQVGSNNTQHNAF